MQETWRCLKKFLFENNEFPYTDSETTDVKDAAAVVDNKGNETDICEEPDEGNESNENNLNDLISYVNLLFWACW